MFAQRIPVATLGFLLLVAGLHFIPADRALLYFSAADIARGETWRLVSGHFMHADLEHLLWNSLGLAVLGTLTERHSTALLWVALGTGIMSVNALLLSPFTQLHYYCGLSGILNSLLVVALWLEWRATRSRLVVAIAIGSVLKVVLEIVLGTSIVTDIGWPSYPCSHAAGLLGGLLAVCARPPASVRSCGGRSAAFGTQAPIK